MGFDSGSVSFRRFAVTGAAPDAVQQEMLDRLSEHALRPTELGVPQELEYGWSGGRHVLDDAFSFEHNVFADALCFALRIDSNKVPGELKKAYQIMEEEAFARGNPSGFISRKQKRDAKQIVQRKIEDEMRSGRFRRSKIVPILWDLVAGVLYCNASIKAEEQLHEIFERTFPGLTLQPLSAGALGLRMLESRHKRRDYEDLRPTRFVPGPEGESQQPEYPWVAKGPQAKDFLGNEFLLWLWQQADSHDGQINIDQGSITVYFDRVLDLDCVFGQTGRDVLHGDGVTRMPEALDALRSGKVPRKAGLVIESAGLMYSLTLGAESLACGSLKLPAVEDADNARVLFEERVALLRDFGKTLDALYAAFLNVRASGSWESHAGAIRKWIVQSSRKPVAAVA
ncbi:hypothetical protein [Fontivita pretiosa]|uniref:hypothetical protein n=1 Tax=Fontivita pretiosa TaxID=2989684 RepID=UPI003D17410E